MKPPTVYDVAADAGVSAMSVSRVLNGHGQVSDQMRKRVMKSVARLGFRKNENARSIRPGQRTGLVGVVITNIDNPYYARVLLGIEDAMDSTDRRIMVGISHGETQREARLVFDFVGRQVEGLIVVPTGGAADHLTPPCLGGLPLVLASRSHPSIRADSVTIDDIDGSYRGMSKLLSKGHRRIAFLGNSHEVSTSQRRFEGYARALAEQGWEIDPRLVDRSCSDAASSRDAALRLMGLDEVPSAVFCANNQVAVGALEVLGAPPAVGRNIAVLCFDDFQLSGLLDLDLTIISHDPRALGRVAARLLLQRLDTDDETPPVQLILPTEVG